MVDKLQLGRTGWGGYYQMSHTADLTLFLFKSIWTRSQGCQKIRFFFLQIKLLSSCTKIDLKLHKLPKTVKIEKNCHKNIFAPNLQWHVYWMMALLLTPWGPLGWINRGDIRVLRFVTVAPPQRIFHFYQIEARCRLY